MSIYYGASVFPCTLLNACKCLLCVNHTYSEILIILEGICSIHTILLPLLCMICVVCIISVVACTLLNDIFWICCSVVSVSLFDITKTMLWKRAAFAAWTVKLYSHTRGLFIWKGITIAVCSSIIAILILCPYRAALNALIHHYLTFSEVTVIFSLAPLTTAAPQLQKSNNLGNPVRRIERFQAPHQ